MIARILDDYSNASLVTGLSAFSAARIAAITGLALFSAITNGLAAAMVHPAERDPALITFLDIGAPFWELVAGLIAYLILRGKQ